MTRKLYNKHGKLCNNEKEACAKYIKETVEDKIEEKMFVLFGDNGVFNPLEHKIGQQHKWKGKPLFAFKKVLPQVFDQYILFLQTYSETRLNLINRSIKDA